MREHTWPTNICVYNVFLFWSCWCKDDIPGSRCFWFWPFGSELVLFHSLLPMTVVYFLWLFAFLSWSKSNFRTQHQLSVRTHLASKYVCVQFSYCFGHVVEKTTARDKAVLFGNVGSEFILLDVFEYSTSYVLDHPSSNRYIVLFWLCWYISTGRLDGKVQTLRFALHLWIRRGNWGLHRFFLWFKYFLSF